MKIKYRQAGIEDAELLVKIYNESTEKDGDVELVRFVDEKILKKQGYSGFNSQNDEEKRIKIK